MPIRVLTGIIVVLFLVVASGVPARAQTRGRDRMVFGGGVGDAVQVVRVGADLSTMYYQMLRESEAGLFDGPREGAFNQASANTSYALNLDHFTAATSWASMGSYRPSTRGNVLVQHFGTANIAGDWNPTRRTRVILSQSVGYRPRDYLSSFGSSFGSAFGSDIGASSPDSLSFLRPDALESRRQYVSADSTLGVERSLSRRTVVAVNYGYSRRYQLPADYRALSQHGDATIRYAITRDLGLNLGYSISQSSARAADVGRLRTEAIDAGVSYSKSLSRTRMTLVSLRTGIGMGNDFSGQRHYRLNAAARLSREIGRSWTAGMSYVRDMHADEVFADTVRSDSIAASLSGLLNDRLLCTVSVAGSRGTVGFAGPDSRVARAGASARLQWAVTRRLAAGLTYGYDLRQIDEAVILPVGVSRQTEAQMLQVSLSTSVPVFHGGRKRNAAR